MRKNKTKDIQKEDKNLEEMHDFAHINFEEMHDFAKNNLEEMQKWYYNGDENRNRTDEFVWC